MITGIVFSTFVTAPKHPSPIGNTAGYGIVKPIEPVVPIQKTDLNLKPR